MTIEVYKSELETLVRDGALLVDVREPSDHETVDGLPGHTHIPLSRIDELAPQLTPKRPLVFYCRSGLLSYQAAEIATHWTDVPVYYLSGGLLSNSDA